MGTGQEFAKKLGTGGAILVLILGIIATMTMFKVRGTPVKDYSPPESGEYFSAHLPELLEEIETNLLPKIDAPGVELELEGEVIAVTGPAEALQTARLAIIHYYDTDLFEFREAVE